MNLCSFCAHSVHSFKPRVTGAGSSAILHPPVLMRYKPVMITIRIIHSAIQQQYISFLLDLLQCYALSSLVCVLFSSDMHEFINLLKAAA